MRRGIGKSISLRVKHAARQFHVSTLLTWAGAGLAFLTIAVAVWSIEKADWISPEPSLITALALSLAAGVVLAAVRLHAAITATFVSIAGLAVTGWQGTLLFTSTKDAGAFRQFWESMTSARPSEGTLFFALFLTLITWIIGYLSFWFVLRRRNAWPAVALGSIMLLVNLGNLPRENYYFFPLFFLCVTMLVATVTLAKQGTGLIAWADRSARRGIGYSAVAVFTVGILVSGISYFVPEPPIENIGIKLDTSSFNSKNVEDLWFNIFANVRSKWALIKSREQERLYFKDPLETGDKIHFLINAARSDYWRIRRYDVYESWGWSSTVETGSARHPWDVIDYEFLSPDGATVSYIVENRLKTDIILSGGELIATDVSTELQTFSEPVGALDGIDGQVRDLAAVVSAQILRPYQKYKVTSSVPAVTPEKLAMAGVSYPAWVKERYLQLPDNLSLRVRELAATITSDANTPYDKAIAIKNYLKRYRYNENAQAPPEKTDGVEYFLFSARDGVCTNFASAMAVLLRVSGVPARLASGYFRGELDQSSGNWVIRGRNYHAWVEVYFPRYGWIEFESTPASPVPGTGSGITDEGINFSTSEPDELPFWMMEEIIGPGGPGEPGGGGTIQRKLPMPYIWLITIASLLALVIFITREVLDRWVRRLARVHTPIEAYDRMCVLAYRSDIGPFEYETPWEFARRLARYLPGLEEDINIVTQNYIAARYSRNRNLEERDKIRMQKAWVELTSSLVKKIIRLRQWSFVRLFWKP